MCSNTTSFNYDHDHDHDHTQNNQYHVGNYRNHNHIQNNQYHVGNDNNANDFCECHNDQRYNHSGHNKKPNICWCLASTCSPIIMDDVVDLDSLDAACLEMIPLIIHGSRRN
jgi:hypothetical protein